MAASARNASESRRQSQRRRAAICHAADIRAAPRAAAARSL